MNDWHRGKPVFRNYVVLLLGVNAMIGRIVLSVYQMYFAQRNICNILM